MHNSHLLSTLSRDIAKNNYYNNSSNLFNSGMVTTGQNMLNKPQIYGYENNDHRLSNTISSLVMPQSTVTVQPQYITNQAINSLMNTENSTQNTKESFEITPITSTPNIQSEQSYIPTKTYVNSEIITINKSTIVIIISVIISLILIHLLLKQRRLELMLIYNMNQDKQQQNKRPLIPYN